MIKAGFDFDTESEQLLEDYIIRTDVCLNRFTATAAETTLLLWHRMMKEGFSACGSFARESKK